MIGQDGYIGVKKGEVWLKLVSLGRVGLGRTRLGWSGAGGSSAVFYMSARHSRYGHDVEAICI